MTTIQRIDRCDGKITLAISAISKLNNEDFVAFVRASRDAEEEWWNETRWTDAVDREIRMRSLLSGGGGPGAPQLP